MSQSLDQALAAFAPPLPFAVGFSGGADSTALLAACAERWPGQVHAFHVHHGLQEQADDFERHCGDVALRLGVPLRSIRVDARHAPGESPEAAARRSRYEAFRALAHADCAQPAIKSIAIAHHADDQVETVLLALSRGAGLPGIAAMPLQAVRGGLTIHRPLLGVQAADIRAWLAVRALPWIDDPTNLDMRYTRNRIRATVLPALQQVFPQIGATVARSAAHAAQAQALLEELAAQDLLALGQPPRIAALRALSSARQANVLRHWLTQAHGSVPSAAQMEELLRQVDACTTGGKDIRLKIGAGHLRREGELLRWYNLPPFPKPTR